MNRPLATGNRPRSAGGAERGCVRGAPAAAGWPPGTPLIPTGARDGSVPLRLVRGGHSRAPWVALALVLAFAAALLPMRAAEVAAPPLSVRRVALLNFAPAEDSFAATRAAADFTALVQARLTATPDLEWVERQEHERVRRELELLGAGVTRGDSIRAGRGLRADLLVLGRLVVTNRTEHALDLEIIELQRADLLASRRVSLPAAGLADPALGAVELAVAGVRAALAETRAYLERTRGQKTVAPLFFQTPIWPPRDESLEVIPREFLAGLSELSARKGFRVLRFPRIAAATPESDLILSGLVETDLEAWRKVADLYLWGEARWIEPPTGNPPPVPAGLELILRLWNGRGKPQEWRETIVADPAGTSRVTAFPAGRVHAVLEQLLARTVDAIHAPAVGEPDATAREEIVRGMIATEAEMIMRIVRPMGIPTKGPACVTFARLRLQSRPYWSASVEVRSARLHEVGCFLDPLNADAHERLLRIKHNLPPTTTNALTTLLRQRDAWGRYVERFGFQHPECKGQPQRCLDILLPYLQTMEELHQRLSLAASYRPIVARGGRANYRESVVNDLATLPEGDFLRLKQEYGAEYVARLQRVVEYLKDGPLEATPMTTTAAYRVSGLALGGVEWHLANRVLTEDLPFTPADRIRLLRLLEPRLFPPGQPLSGRLDAAQLKRAFAAAGEPGGEQVWLERLAPPPAMAPTNSVAKMPTSPAAPVPSAPAPAAAATNLAFVSPPLFQLALPVLKVARCDPPVEMIRFPGDENIVAVHQLALTSDGTLWALAGEPSDSVPPAPSNLRFSATPPRIRTLSLWKLARGRTEAVRVAEISKERLQGGFLVHGDHLWVGGPQLSRWRLADGQWTNFGLREGLPLAQVNAPVIAGGRLYVSGQGEIYGCDMGDGRSWRVEPRVWPGLWNNPNLFPVGSELVAHGFVADVFVPPGEIGVGSGAVVGGYDATAFRDPVSGKWLELGARFPSAHPAVLNSATSNLPKICVAAAADGGLWVGEKSGLHQLDYATLRLSHWPVAGLPRGLAPISEKSDKGVGYWASYYWGPARMPEGPFGPALRGWLAERTRRLAMEIGPSDIRPAALPGAVTALASDGEFLWVACGPDVLVWHPATSRWAGRFTLPHPVQALAGDANHLWAGLSAQTSQPGQPVLVRLPKAAVLGRPRDQWVLDADDEAAWRKRASGLDPRSQIVAAFHRGNAAEVVTRLSATPLAQLDVEGLLLVGLGHDFLGLDDPARAQAAWDELARREPVHTWATVAADLAVAHSAQRATLARLGPDFFRQHDTDSDGRLSASERARAVLDAAFWAAQIAADTRTSTEVERLRKNYDLDGDGLFNPTEFHEMRRREPALADDHSSRPSWYVLLFMDSNRDGKLSVDELALGRRVWTSRPGLYNQPPPPGLPRDRRGPP